VEACVKELMDPNTVLGHFDDVVIDEVIDDEQDDGDGVEDDTDLLPLVPLALAEPKDPGEKVKKKKTEAKKVVARPPNRKGTEKKQAKKKAGGGGGGGSSANQAMDVADESDSEPGNDLAWTLTLHNYEERHVVAFSDTDRVRAVLLRCLDVLDLSHIDPDTCAMNYLTRLSEWQPLVQSKHLANKMEVAVFLDEDEDEEKEVEEVFSLAEALLDEDDEGDQEENDGEQEAGDDGGLLGDA